MKDNGGAFVTATDSVNVKIVYENLLPYTAYSLYCYTEDFKSHGMKLAEVISTSLGNFLLVYICNFHVLSHLLLNYICKLHWNL